MGFHVTNVLRTLTVLMKIWILPTARQLFKPVFFSAYSLGAIRKGRLADPGEGAQKCGHLYVLKIKINAT